MEAIFVFLIIFLFGLHYVLLKKTNNKILRVCSCLALPLFPAVLYVGVKMQGLQYFWENLDQGAFIFSLISLPYVFGLVLWFCLIYLGTFIVLLIEDFWVSRSGPELE